MLATLKMFDKVIGTYQRYVVNLPTNPEAVADSAEKLKMVALRLTNLTMRLNRIVEAMKVTPDTDVTEINAVLETTHKAEILSGWISETMEVLQRNLGKKEG